MHKPTISMQIAPAQLAALRTIAAEMGYTIGRGKEPKKGSIRGMLLGIASGNVAVSRQTNVTIDTEDEMDKNLSDLAEKIYIAVYGDNDSKRLHSQKTTEIYDWLKAGDLPKNPSVSKLADEWREYDNQ